MSERSGPATGAENPWAARPKRKRGRRILLISGGSLLVLVVVFLLLVPTIAGSLAPGIVSDALKGTISGKTDVGAVSLSWFGKQTIGPVTVKDDSGRTIASLNIEASPGLLSLAMGGAGLSSLDLGQVKVSGSATITRGKDGKTNAERVLGGGGGAAAPASSSSKGGGGTLPKGLAARVVVDTLDVHFIDESAPAGSSVAVIDLRGVRMDASISGGNAKLTLSAPTFYGATADAAKPGGSLSIDAKVTGLADSSGKLQPDAASIDVNVEAKDIAVAIADALADMDNKLIAAVGDTLQASVHAKGKLNEGDAAITVSSKGINADVAFKSAGGVITSAKPGTIALKTSGMLPLIPGAEQSLKAQDDVKFTKLPDVTVTLSTLSVPLPSAGKPLDLRSAALVVDLATAEATGTVRIPTDTGTSGPAQAYRLAPFTVRIDGHEPAKQVSIKAETSATLDNKSAGKLAIDITAANPLDSSGAIKSGLPSRIDGQVSLTGFMTAIAQPFLAGAGVDVAKDVGPQIDLVCKASAAGDDAKPAAAPSTDDIPTTHFTLDINSANIKAIARVLVDKGILTTEDQGVEVKVGTLGPLATRELKGAGVSIESGMGVTLTASDISLEVKAISGPKTAARPNGPDLRAGRALIKLETTQAKGKIAAPGQPVRAFDLAPFVAAVDSKSLLRGAAIQAKTSIALDGASAGGVDVNLVASSLLSADGSLRPGLPPVTGRVMLAGISTRVVQPWVEASGLNLPDGIGPTVDVTVTATPSGGAPSDAELPRTDLAVSVKSANLNGSAQLTLDGSTVRSRAPGAEFSLNSPGVLAAKALEKSGYRLSPGGSAKATIRNLVFALAGSPLDSAIADLDVSVGGFAIAPTGAAPGAPADALALTQLTLTTKLSPGSPPSIDIKGSGSQGGGQFTANGSLQVPGLFTKPVGGGPVQITPQNARPLGAIQIANLPTSLAVLIMPAPKPGPQESGPDTVRLIRDAVGPWITITFDAAARQGSPNARDISLTLAATKLTGGIKAGVDDAVFSLSKLDFRTTIDPDLAGTLFSMIGSQLESKPALSGPALIAITADPFTIPMKGLEPQLAQAGDVALKIGLEGKTLIKDISFKDQAGQKRDVGVIGLQDILLKAKLPISSLAQGGPPKPVEVAFTGGVLGSADQRIVDVNGSVKTSIAGGQPAGDLNASLALSILDSKRLDAILNKPGMISGGVGDTFNLNASAAVKLPPAGTSAGALDRSALELSITSPRVSTAQPLKATITSDRIALDSPMVLNWSVDQAWANTFLLAPPPAKAGAKPNPNPLLFTNSPKMVVSVSKLVIATGAGLGPLKPGVFAADVEAKAPEVGLASGKAGAALKGFAARISGGIEPGVIGFSLRADDLGTGPGPKNAPALLFQGGLYHIADDHGIVTPDSAVLTMTGDAYGMPSALLDAVAQMGGMLSEALGPTVTIDVKTEGANQTRGNIVAKATSPRAEVNIKGMIAGGVFVTEGPPEIATLKVITPELGHMLVNGLPLIGTFEKRAEDGPAIIRTTSLKVPVDGDVKKLNGDVTIEMGTARFETSKFFGAIVRLVRQKDSGMIGHRLDPLLVNFKDGVGTYQRWKIPLGEFTVDTRGTVDLVNRQLDVITYIPFGALTDEAAGKLNTGLGRLIGGAVPLLEQATMVPFHTKGSFDNPDTKVDPELMLKEAGKSLLRPDQLLKNGIQDLLKKAGNK